MKGGEVPPAPGPLEANASEPLELQAPPPVSEQEVRARQERARQEAAARGLSALLVAGRSFYDRVGDLAYLTRHFPPFPATAHGPGHVAWGHGFLLLPCGTGPTTLIVDPAGVRPDLAVADEVLQGTDLAALLAGALERLRLATGRVGVVGDDLWPAALREALSMRLPALELVAADDLVRSMRRLKSPAELALLRHAAQVADRALRAALGAAVPGATERRVSAAGTAAALEGGADFVRYLRVHSGPWSAAGSRWPPATGRRLEAGELLALDIIGACGGYQFDVLRSTAVGGRAADPERRQLLEAVLEAVEASVAQARPGRTCDDVVQAGLSRLAARGLGAHARTFAGHGIGLETVEEPWLVAGNRTPLQPGMVLCIEPGCYIPGWGGASIEQEVVVTEGEPEVITPTPVRLWADP